MSASSHWLDAGGWVGQLHPGRPDATTAVVLFNAGAIHRVGPFRLHVALARALARQGFPVARVDQPGVGDAIGPAARPMASLAEGLLDHLQAVTGCRRFVVGGICSAADLGWKLALQDTRVAGLVLVDPVARRAHPAHRLGQLSMLWQRGPAGWADLLRRRLHPGAAPVQPADSELRDWPAPGQEGPQLERLVGRGVELFVLYTGGAADYMTHRWQFYGGFGRAARDPRVHFQHWRHCDHLFYRPDDRDRLVDALVAWARERVGPDG